MWNSYDWGNQFEMAYLPLLLKGGSRSQILTWNWLKIVWVYMGNNIVKFGWGGISKQIMPLFVVHSFFFSVSIFMYQDVAVKNISTFDMTKETAKPRMPLCILMAHASSENCSVTTLTNYRHFQRYTSKFNISWLLAFCAGNSQATGNFPS